MHFKHCMPSDTGCYIEILTMLTYAAKLVILI